MGVSYRTESKRTESRAGRGGTGKNFLVALHLFHLSFLSRFLFLAFAGTGPRHICFCLTGRWARLFFCMISMSFTKKGEENEVMSSFFGFYCWDFLS